MDEIAPFPPTHWLSLGYSREHAVAQMRLNMTLIEATSQLNQSIRTAAGGATETTIDIRIHFGNDVVSAPLEGPLLPDTTLMPLWKDFAAALGSLAASKSVSINLAIEGVRLSTQVLSILEPAFKAAPIKHLVLYNNRLQMDGINFVTRVLDANHSLSCLCLTEIEIEIECVNAVLSLVEAAREHPVLGLGLLNYFCLVKCGIGRILPIAPEIVPVLLNLRKVCLEGNDLGSHAASLISNCLATNPSIKGLHLDGNLFNDDDARMFANSFKTNTNLTRLFLRDNNFTDAGFKTLYKSVYDDRSLVTIYDSNHTCRLHLYDEGVQIPNGIEEAVLRMNGITFHRYTAFSGSLRLQCFLRCERDANGNTSGALELLQVEGRKKVKMLHAVQGGNAGEINMQWIEKIPVELMPKVLVFLQESGRFVGTEDLVLQGGRYVGAEERSLRLNNLFQVIRARQEVTSFHGVPLARLGV